MKLTAISKTYNRKNSTSFTALDHIDLTFDSCGLVIILGASGCGKTTLLNILSGIDKDVQGEIQNSFENDYMKQEIELIESMTVLENLRIASDDEEEIKEYLVVFELDNFKDKKCYKLSDGQKRRVQLIRCLLSNKPLLLLDEPTNALDYSMTILIMDTLKKYAQEHLVIMTTHDTSLVEKYADRVIRIESGAIIEEREIHSLSKLENQLRYKQPLPSYFYLAFHHILSRPLKSIVFSLMISFLIMSLYLTVSLFSGAEVSFRQAHDFKNGRNLILSRPIEKPYFDPFEGQRFLYYDRYWSKEMQNLIDEVEEIVMIKLYSSDDYVGHNVFIYENGDYLNGEPIVNRSTEEVRKESRWLSETFYQDKYKHSTKMERDPFFYPERFKDGFESTTDKFITGHQITFYDIVNGYEIPILYGTNQTGQGETILSLDYADFLMRYYELEDYEELLGREIRFGVHTRANGPMLIRDETSESSNKMEELIPRFYPSEVYLTVVGISSLELPFKNAVFFNNGFLKNPFIENFVKNIDLYEGDYVEFFLQPGSDYDQILKKVNEIVPPDFSKLISYSEKTKEVGFAYSSFVPYVLLMTGVFVAIVFLWFFLERKRNTKEMTIVQRYGFSLNGYIVIRESLYFVVIHLLLMLCFFGAISGINHFVLQFSIAELLSFSFGLFILLDVIVFLFLFIVERMFLRVVK